MKPQLEPVKCRKHGKPFCVFNNTLIDDGITGTFMVVYGCYRCQRMVARRSNHAAIRAWNSLMGKK